MKHYSKSLDLLIASQQLALKGKMQESAKYFAKALKQKDLKKTLAALDQLNGENAKREQAEAAGLKPKVAKPASAPVVKRKATTANDSDIFNSLIDDMSAEEADLDDVLEMPETAGEDNGQGESDLDVGNDDASDLDTSPTEDTEEATFDDMDFTDLADLSDLSDEDFGGDDFGSEEANTTGEGDLDTRPPTPCDPEELPEGEEAPTPPPVPKAEDTTVVSKARTAALAARKKQLIQAKKAKALKLAQASPEEKARIEKMTRVNHNLAALQRMSPVIQAARVATRPKK
jgi:hypothetical protein